jgi:hypothetical protein
MAIALVAGQVEGVNSGGYIDHLDISFPGATTAGNAVIVLAVTGIAESVPAGGVTGTGTYVRDIGGAGNSRGIYSQLNIAGDVGGIIFTPTSSGYLGLVIAEFSGIATSSAFEADCGTLDAHASDTNHHVSTSSNTTAADLIIGGGAGELWFGRTHVAAGDSTLIHDLSGAQDGVLVYEIQAEAGAATLNWTSSGAEIFLNVLAAYKPVAAGGRTTKNTDPWNLGQGHGMSFRMVKINNP